jgi:hypothetical protein
MDEEKIETQFEEKTDDVDEEIKEPEGAGEITPDGDI